ncbi:MAG: hypothetical protein WC753_01345 [Candidatus Gracilibacteria bacterium]
MLSERISSIIETLKAGGQSAPLLVSEQTVCDIISELFRVEIYTLDDLEEKGIADCVWHDCSDKDAKGHKVEFVRKFVEKLYQKPAGDIFVAIFLNIDALADTAYSSLLNIFEEVPNQVLILVTSSSPDKILPTLQSRIVTLDTEGINREHNPLESAIENFLSGQPEALFALTLGKDFKKEQALWVITGLQNAVLNGTLSTRHAKNIRETRLLLETTNTIAKYLIDKLLISLLCE